VDRVYLLCVHHLEVLDAELINNVAEDLRGLVDVLPSMDPLGRAGLVVLVYIAVLIHLSLQRQSKR
jgi:hypothetical protein